ncbi:competence type IV pilus minor pilin ComGD [Bacillus sp. UNCCL13]|nr:competence type IV pilus minor pilin ComGD [Bacillus sp. UNCCL13]
MKVNSRGFTLIESLVVLSAFLILASISIFQVKPQHDLIEKKTFISQLQADLFYGQQYAISHQRDVTVYFMMDQHYYYLFDKTDSNTVMVVERHYSKSISLVPGSLSYTFKFLSDGNVNKFGTLLIDIGEKRFRLTILIGKGRFYVSEE